MICCGDHPVVLLHAVADLRRDGVFQCQLLRSDFVAAAAAASAHEDARYTRELSMTRQQYGHSEANEASMLGGK